MAENEHAIGAARLAVLQQRQNFMLRHVFFIAWEGNLSSSHESLLRQLLRAPSDYVAPTDHDAALIIPHLGTASPWGSKAADILRRCHLNGLQRIERGLFICGGGDEWKIASLADKMTQTILRPPHLNDWQKLFADSAARPLRRLEVMTDTLQHVNHEWGLSLSAADIEHLCGVFGRLARKATDAELLMFAQANSEHCRHKIFNARWEDRSESLMQSIRRTHAANPQGVITAFVDNAAVITGAAGEDFAPNADGVYTLGTGGLLLVAKAETHNHPTAVCPFAGAATGSGGEIRDEAAAGRGAATRAGFAGFIVSHLEVPQCGDMMHAALPAHLASPLQIMIDGPLGAAAFCNEFGRPTLAGFFRCYEQRLASRHFGFHKPMMLAGGMGHILPAATGKLPIPAGAKIIQIGGPGFRIGIGGGAASSRAGGTAAQLDFDSVQRDNAEMQRRAQEVIDACRRPPFDGLILSLHDVGAGGLANAVIEMVYDAGRGAKIALAAVPIEDKSLSPAEIWCNESQERYVLALMAESVDAFAALCHREACPFAIIGEATAEMNIVVSHHEQTVVAMPLAEVLGGVASPLLHYAPPPPTPTPRLEVDIALGEAAYTVLRHPTVSCKRFLINIGDRSVGGLCARDQMVGPWQVPVADCAAFFNDYTNVGGAAFALGERPNIAALHCGCGARMAVAEALSNLAAADIGDLRRVKLSLNWLANCADDMRCSELRDAVRAAADFCEDIGVGVIVGKDSLSMSIEGEDSDAPTVESPATAAAMAFSPIDNAQRILTPQLSGRTDTLLILAAPSTQQRLGGSVLSLATGLYTSAPPPDVEAKTMAAFWRAIAVCHEQNLLLAYHDRADGGLWACACEMAFAANCGVLLVADGLCSTASETDGGAAVGGREIAALFNEEIGALLEVPRESAAAVMKIFADAGLPQAAQTVGYATVERRLRIYDGGEKLLDESLDDLWRAWDEVSYEITRRRDAPECAAAEHQRDFADDPGLFARVPFAMDTDAPKYVGTRPRVAILREQGSNGQREMAAAFTRAGFEAVDVAMGDLRAGKRLDSFHGLAWCGGFSFGDVLGGGYGWAAGILHEPMLAEMFTEFFARADTFTFGACNGCQSLALLQPLMPAAETWHFPQFLPNHSKRFEARLVLTEILPSPSPLLVNMAGAILPIVSSHAEGRACFNKESEKEQATAVLRFVDHHGAATEKYPFNPNGTAAGLTGFCSPDGRITLMMPHPERVFRRGQMSWSPPQWNSDASPWLKLFLNARRFVG